jgi:hypothetical protein
MTVLTRRAEESAVFLFSVFAKAGWTATGRVLDRNARRKIHVLGKYAADTSLNLASVLLAKTVETVNT